MTQHNPNLRAFTDPAFGIAGPVTELPRPEGATLKELIDLVPLEHEALRPHLVAKINGAEIDRRYYHLIRPKDGTFVTLCLPVHGGDKGAGKILSAVAGIALLGASLFVGAFGVPGLFAAGSIGARVAAAGLSIGASLLLQGLQPRQQGRQPSADLDQVGSASAQNRFEPGAYLPRVIGTRRIAPPHALPPYTTIDGDDQTVTACYALAGPHAISDIKIGETIISNADDIDIEIREGFSDDPDLTLITETVIEQSLNLKLSTFRTKPDDGKGNEVDDSVSPYEPVWHRVETKKGPDKARLFFTFDKGFSDSTGNEAITSLRMRVRKSGTATWTNLPELVFQGKRPAAVVRCQLDLNWVAPGSMPGSSTAFSSNKRGFSWRYDTFNTWSADSYFTSTYPNAITWESSQKVSVYLDTTTFPQDESYEIEVKRGFGCQDEDFNPGVPSIDTNGGAPYYGDFFTPYNDSGTLKLPRDQDAVITSLVLVSIQSIYDEYPFDLTGQPTCLIAIKARNRNIDQLTCLASGYTEDRANARILAGDEAGNTRVLAGDEAGNTRVMASVFGVNQTTKNPAAWYREVLSDGNFNAEPVDESLIDLDNLADWYDWCDANGYEVNAVLQGQPITEVLSLIAQAGFARPRYAATHGVIMDKARSSPVGLITQRNAAGFSFQKPFARLPHALRVSVADEDNGYDVSERTVYADGYNADGSGGLTEATRFEAISYPGITDTALADARALRDMRFARHRSRLITFQMDIEHLEFQLGDMVLLETDILGQIGGRGRIDSIATSGGLVTSVTLDEKPDFADASEKAIAFRLTDGTVRVERVSSVSGNSVTFLNPFAMPTNGGDDAIIAGTLAATGAWGTEAREVLIWDIAPGPELTARVTVVDHAKGAIYGLYEMLAGEGRFTLTGNDADLVLGFGLSAGQGSFTLNGQAAQFIRALTIPAAQGSFSLSGQDVSFTGGLILSAALGSFTLSGQASGLLHAAYLAAAHGSFSLSGQSAALKRDLSVSLGHGSFTLSGQAAGLDWSTTLSAAQGSFALSGFAAGFLRAEILTASMGSFALSGQAAALKRDFTMTAGHGSFTLGGQAADLLIADLRILAGDEAGNTRVLAGDEAGNFREVASV